ncbi:cyclic nucleotide-binding domain-containing protein [Xanthobacter tagetidis]|uniref:Crp/Fnr family transcriptional regulator n=1 Tax=Xanthobacter tagetidis TaxID=60216 RepID=A0A3L7AMX7_9HYPH|nr:Crp/Fnr family transcriptional regulator [Xanthobacter tagetidis]MBB6308192.1 CRP-like cAMP-binding protein [Xanthobacter tagetidis]RLP81809.1 Crp/Fnr family transcriptional regulator [Xanthobacter tagetidis]
MSLETDIALLRQVPTFDILNGEALRILAISSEQKVLAEGDVLFKAGDDADCAYVLASGLLHFIREKEGVEPELLHALEPVALIGETSLILANKRPATAVAAAPCVLMRLSRSTFVRTLEGFPDVAQRMRKMFAARLEATLGALGTVAARLESEGLGPRRR